MDELFTPDENVRRLQAVGVDPLFIAINTGDLGAVKRLIAGLPVDCTNLVSTQEQAPDETSVTYLVKTFGRAGPVFDSFARMHW